METGTLHRSLKEKQRQERADLILQAAQAVFTEKGYHDTSMDEIAARVGVAKGTVYLYFPSKQDLVFALFERELEVFLDVVTQVSASRLPARTKLERLFQHVYSGLPGQRIHLLLSLFTNMEVRKDVLEKKEQMRERMEDVAARLSTVIEEGKVAGEFTSEISTSVMLNTFFLFLSPQTYRHVLDTGLLSPEELATQLGRIYFEGIVAPH
jgi:AcrR family transcriptional regulator